ncbi:MAG: dephospho-CoA kinase [Planctomycetes bacterium]|jgi:dephospho-CoA kinase|nr:dephospho-CoA kinase [Planctomycetota bacterium]
MAAKPFVIGIVGGVASGKSAVAGLFAERGARVIDADALAREVLGEPAVREALARAFGPSVLDASGAVDRKALAGAAFGPPPRAEELNRIVHPEVRRRLLEAAGRGGGAAVFDAPLLLEAGMGGDCDLLVFVDAPEPVRRARAAARGWAPGEWERREACQRPVEEKRRLAGAALDNGGSLERTREQVAELWRTRILPGLSAGRGPGARESGPDRRKPV